MGRTDQPSFVDLMVSGKLGRNEMLQRVSDQVKWYRFEKLLRVLKPEGAGRPPFEPLAMFKALLLQHWYDLSDAELEETLNDRVSFRRFVGLGLEASAPDHTTLCRFRNRLVEAGLESRLFAEFDRQLEQRGLVLKRGTMIDATLVASAHRRPPSDQPQEAVDADAATSAYEGRKGTYYGYKAHVGVDRGSRLIRSAVLTAGNVNETEVADALVRGDEAAVYADKAYATAARRAWLKRLGIKARIMHKRRGGLRSPPLRASQVRHNKLIAPIRAGVEAVFATLKRWMGYRQVRYRGLRRNSAHLQLLALAYNMRRASLLAA